MFLHISGIFEVLLLFLAMFGLIGLGFFLGRRSIAASRFASPRGDMPYQEMYGRADAPPVFTQRGQDFPYTPGNIPPQGQYYGGSNPMMQQGMGPWAAGGLGAIGGGLLGYGLGQAMAGQGSLSPDAQAAEAQNNLQENVVPLSDNVVGDLSGYDGGSFDAGSDFGDIGV